MENIFLKVGRITFAICFFLYGIGHFTSVSSFAELLPVKGAEYLIYFTGICLIAASISIVIKKQIALATLLLAIMILIFIFTVHGPDMFSTNPMIKARGTGNTFKDIGLIGGCLFMHGFYRKPNNL